MRVKLWRCLFILVSLLLLSSPEAFAQCQPAADGDLTLPGPHDSCFVFRAISTGEDTRPFAGKTFYIGDPQGDEKEYIAAMVVNGIFIEERPNNSQQAVYYLGKYEVTEGQYYALMGLPEGRDKSLLQSKMPITNISYYEVLAFIDKLNIWMFANALDKLPHVRSTPGFMRLPSEAEWEFAARGGLAVKQDVFEKQHSYGDALASHEWFSGPSSSHDKVQPVGARQPNPLGLHDMLGNVSEIVTGNYQLRYYQGSVGGQIARGGNVFTKEERMRASLRTEQPLYRVDRNNEIVVGSSPTTGFRLAIGAPVLSDREAINSIAESWEEYLGSGTANMPAELSVASASQQADAAMGSAKEYIDRLKSFAASSEAAQKDIAFIESLIKQAEITRRQGDERSAMAAVRMASFIGVVLSTELPKEQTLLKTIADMEKDGASESTLERLKNAAHDVSSRIAGNLNAYRDPLSQLAELDNGLVMNAFEAQIKYRSEENIREEDKHRNLAVLILVQQHYQTFIKEKRADLDKWKSDFSGLPNSTNRNE